MHNFAIAWNHDKYFHTWIKLHFKIMFIFFPQLFMFQNFFCLILRNLLLIFSLNLFTVISSICSAAKIAPK